MQTSAGQPVRSIQHPASPPPNLIDGYPAAPRFIVSLRACPWNTCLVTHNYLRALHTTLEPACGVGGVPNDWASNALFPNYIHRGYSPRVVQGSEADREFSERPDVRRFFAAGQWRLDHLGEYAADRRLLRP